MAMITGMAVVAFASVIGQGMHTSFFSQAAGSNAAGAVTVVEAKEIMPVIGAAAALEEKTPATVMAELTPAGAAGALVLDDAGAKSAAESAVLSVTEAEGFAEEIKVAQAEAEAEELARDPEHFSSLVIAKVNDFVNVRDIPSTDGEVVGKLYDKSAGQFLGEEDGWYKISSGNVTGYVKAEYCVTGDDAIELAKKVGTRMAVVNTTTLKVRAEASVDSEVLGLVPIEEELVVLEETEDWIKVSIEEGDGYVSKEFVNLRTDFVHAESKAEEEARLAREEAERKAARQAAEAARASASKKNNNNSNKSGANYTVPDISGSGLGTEVAQYACQFVGNPYQYGGSSLTQGTDCSGFVMSVYAHFGVSLPHSSTADRQRGTAVEGGLENAQPGDILCYSGHVAIYIGDGKIVHASTSRTGIVIGNANYRGLLAIRRIF
ncbi:MAG: Murein DD-endopeptidase MepS/Murein LD-carboxypeptidase precursor [Firmicutes bacterium ADurb.Bin354]|nr:MAG: Murein DD-endopeptidase MepS/Murein LD-carboxypeptidase precursor [Firmicutes bacterium ADurb.Bin354]